MDREKIRPAEESELGGEASRGCRSALPGKRPSDSLSGKLGARRDYAATLAVFLAVLRDFSRSSRSARTQSSSGFPGAPLRSR